MTVRNLRVWLLALTCALLIASQRSLAQEEIEALEEADDDKLPPLEQRTHYWFNEVTQESQWTKPEYEYTDPESGKVYYMDPETKETTWEKPDSLKWEEVEDSEGKGTYYFNEATGISQWEKPAMFGWRKVSVDEGEPPEDHEEL